MYGQLFRFDEGRILQEAVPSGFGILNPAQFGPNLTLLRGQAIGMKTSTNKMYPLNRGASDGTENFAGLAQYDFATDANGIVYFVNGGTAASPSYFQSGQEYADFWQSGIFKQDQLLTAPVGTPTAEIDTATPTGTVTAGDIWGIYNPAGVGTTVVANATATVAAIITQMKNQWNADAACAALATATSSSTVLTLTAVTAGVAMNLTSTFTAASSFLPVFVVATAAASGQQLEVDTFTPGSTIATGYTYTVTITYPNLTTTAVTYTALSTDTTATLIATGLRAAWDANGSAANYATASGTATFILTAANLGQVMNLAASNTGSSGTFTKAVTNAAYDYNFADIQAGRPGAYIMNPNGWVVLP